MNNPQQPFRNEERKPAPRTRSNVPVMFRRKYSRNDEPGLLKNISETGAFLSQKEAPLEVGSKVNLIIDFAGFKREITAKVV
ncbi:MAG: PilZ domain-containing protein, partial [Bdellovibrionaceae bacterium]|nr:PilZ domain-containing protein [Pseudobdellovibrionaceae bacterium]